MACGAGGYASSTAGSTTRRCRPLTGSRRGALHRGTLNRPSGRPPRSSVEPMTFRCRLCCPTEAGGSDFAQQVLSVLLKRQRRARHGGNPVSAVEESADRLIDEIPGRGRTRRGSRARRLIAGSRAVDGRNLRACLRCLQAHCDADRQADLWSQFSPHADTPCPDAAAAAWATIIGLAGRAGPSFTILVSTGKRLKPLLRPGNDQGSALRFTP